MRLADLRQAVQEADESDIILLTGASRDDWLAQLDQALAACRLDRLRNWATSDDQRPSGKPADR